MGLDTVNPRLRARLIQVARSGGFVAYGELMREFDMDNRFLLAEELGNVSDDCAQRGEPLLSAVGVTQDTMTPSAGFFAKATEHAGYSGNRDETEQLRWWLDYLATVQAYWRDREGEDGGGAS